MKKLLTLVVIHQEGRVLLGMKKKGFGEGLWNGFGGKVEPGEQIEDAAIREVNEEACITPTSIRRQGILEFHVQGEENILEVHIFSATYFSGTPQETEEMRPEWFPVDSIPYDEMWPDDRYWLPELLKGENFTGVFTFETNGALVDHTLKIES